MVEAVRRLCPGVPIAILTNASLLWLDEVLEGASKADFLVAKLDAPDSTALRAINRPAEGLTHELLVEGLKKARKALSGGRLAIQMMFLRAHDRPLNTDRSSLKKFIELLKAVRPDQVQVNTPTRPPAELYVEPLGQEELEAVASYIRAGLEGTGVEVIYWRQPSLERLRPRALSLRDAIVSVLERRPCRFHELCAISGGEPLAVRAELDRLLSEGLLAVRTYKGERFYILKG